MRAEVEDAGSEKKIAILGAGLLGGSLALALQRIDGYAAVLWARRVEVLAEARAVGIYRATVDLADALSDVDLVVLATPVGAMRSVIEAALPHLSRPTVMTDMGSVKVLPEEEISAVLEGSDHTFIGSHPMAGSEQTGVTAARANLFDGATTITCSDGRPSSAVDLVRQLWTDLGMQIVDLSPAAHDAAVARVSHFPHILAAVCAAVALEDRSLAPLAGGGLRDTSRVASGEPSMWTEIVMENRDAVIESLECAQQSIGEILNSLRASNHERVQTFFSDAKASRDHLSDLQQPDPDRI